LYRRNFFALRAGFSIDGCALDNYTPDDFRISAQTVTSFKMRMRAENRHTLPIELSQLTARREKEPVLQGAEVPVVPRGTGKHDAEALWERIQFKTANNWNKDEHLRRFHLVVESRREGFIFKKQTIGKPEKTKYRN
jgi:hypothetical protein